MKFYTTRCKVTYNVAVTVEADSVEEARGKIAAGEFETDDPTAEMIDWSDPTTDVEEV